MWMSKEKNIDAVPLSSQCLCYMIIKPRLKCIDDSQGKARRQERQNKIK